ncbi:hypothetical protein JIN84_19700 [Luteolibacter yonseiensis]|uniref:Uncharacterized protein n=1 Tax=Luteolibacter yonseiensis TaxID=1144680 RepID=A0A934R9X6_9BACT|nr:hypothetical protein [Luteolibacter yonseiensis]MBK1817855.1 hypothetical protein [Luteolibacter yonseiensis]
MIKVPPSVALGEDFTLHVEVTNPSDSPLFLESISLGDNLNKGFEYLDAVPKPVANSIYDDEISLEWSEILLPGQTFTADISLKAVKAGIWTGTLEFWNEDFADYVSSSVTIRVNPSAPPEGSVPDSLSPVRNPGE